MAKEEVEVYIFDSATLEAEISHVCSVEVYIIDDSELEELIN